MNILEKIILWIAIVAVFICSIISGFINGKNDFWSMNISDALGLVITGIIFFHISDMLSSRDKKNEKFVQLLEKLQINISDERLIHIKSQEDVDYVKLRIRNIANNITCLNKMNVSNKDVKNKLAYIKEKFDAYEELFDNHMHDFEFLEKSKTDFSNKVELIQNKCDEIIVDMYK